MPKPVQHAAPKPPAHQGVDPVGAGESVPRPGQCRCQACRQDRNPAHDAAFALNYQPAFAHVSRLEGSYFPPPQSGVRCEQQNQAASWLALFK